ncbi:MAG: HD domain-containing protein [Clostridiales bacterium]|nr:HD domain-containing protein [Clostridiales bacterium]
MTERELRLEIDEYVTYVLSLGDMESTPGAKVIHDSIHGTSMFLGHEIALIDLPIIQRLRRISQTDVASLVFPAANHNRFEHTVGVATIAGSMVESLYKRGNPLLSNIDKDYTYHNCRAAAILHDCGHGPFSHSSEYTFKHWLKDIKRTNPRLAAASAHEILSFMIATSDPMREYNERVIKGVYGVDIDLDFVGDMIVGYVDKTKRPDLAFAVAIINGAFDADKLDYIMRDAYSTGINMPLDLPRLMYTLDVLKDAEGLTRLAIDSSGVSSLEGIIFNKMMLTATIYQHQKVRCAGCVLRSVFAKSASLYSPCDFLRITDDDVFSLESDLPEVKEYINILRNRILPKRALCISPRTLENPSALGRIINAFGDEGIREKLTEEICSYASVHLSHELPREFVWLDCPPHAVFKEASQCIIKSPGEYMPLTEIFPVDDWVRTFSESKYHGFVYTMPCHREAAYASSRAVLEGAFGVKFNDLARRLCKL